MRVKRTRLIAMVLLLAVAQIGAGWRYSPTPIPPRPETPQQPAPPVKIILADPLDQVSVKKETHSELREQRGISGEEFQEQDISRDKPKASEPDTINTENELFTPPPGSTSIRLISPTTNLAFTMSPNGNLFAGEIVSQPTGMTVAVYLFPQNTSLLPTADQAPIIKSLASPFTPPPGSASLRSSTSTTNMTFVMTLPNGDHFGGKVASLSSGLTANLYLLIQNPIPKTIPTYVASNPTPLATTPTSTASNPTTVTANQTNGSPQNAQAAPQHATMRAAILPISQSQPNQPPTVIHTLVFIFAIITIIVIVALWPKISSIPQVNSLIILIKCIGETAVRFAVTAAQYCHLI